MTLPEDELLGSSWIPACGPKSRRPMVLVVDDQPSIILTLSEILSDHCEVCMATGGLQALAFCEFRLPDLILLDVVMPGINGYETCRLLKSKSATQEIPIIFVTAQDQIDAEVRGLSEGAVDFITKPVSAPIVRARVRTHLTLKFQAETMRSLAMLDGLTGVANRREFDTVLAEEWNRCAALNLGLSLILIDIDYFKRYNDQYGHQRGDICLKVIAATLKASVQQSAALVARYGGEEFACILPDTLLPGAEQVGQGLVQSAWDLGLVHEASQVAKLVTISVGVAATRPIFGVDPARLVAAADRMLYSAKDAGRARCHAERVELAPSA